MNQNFRAPAIALLSTLAWNGVLASSLAAFASPAEFRAGFASADITPPVDWRRAGNYTELISTGVNDPLMTKAMVVLRNGFNWKLTEIAAWCKSLRLLAKYLAFCGRDPTTAVRRQWVCGGPSPN